MTRMINPCYEGSQKLIDRRYLIRIFYDGSMKNSLCNDHVTAIGKFDPPTCV